MNAASPAWGSASCRAAAASLRTIGLWQPTAPIFQPRVSIYSRHPASERPPAPPRPRALLPWSAARLGAWPCPPPIMCLSPHLLHAPTPRPAPGGPSQGMVVSATTCRNMQGGTKPRTHRTFQKQAWPAGAGKGFRTAVVCVENVDQPLSHPALSISFYLPPGWWYQQHIPGGFSHNPSLQHCVESECLSRRLAVPREEGD